MATIDRTKWFQHIGHTPRRGQQALYDAWDAGHRYLGLFSFPRGGKSYGAARLVEPILLEEDKHVWVVAPNYALGAKEFGYIYQDFAETGWLRRAKRRYFDVRSGNMAIEFPWGSWIRVLSAENPDSLLGEELDVIVLAEGSRLPEEIFDRYLFARIEKRRGRVIVPSTPKGFNWLYHKFRVPSLQTIEGRPNDLYDPSFWSVVVSADPELGDLYEPGIYAPESVARMKRLLPRPLYLEQVGGEFASYAGNIYAFDPRQHECAVFAIPEEWPVVVGWDHGADNPTAILVGSWAPDGTVYWWGEVYVAGYAAAEYAQMLRHVLGMRRPSAIAVDPSAKQVRIELARVGMSTCIPHDRQVEARITRVTSLMREGKWKVLTGRCPNLVKEIQAWEWDEDHPGRPRPHQRCHALDAMGYACLAYVPVATEHAPYTGTVPGETPEQHRMWAGLRKRDREQEEREQHRETWHELEEDPFEETAAVYAEAYDPGM